MIQNKRMHNLKVDKALRDIIPPPSPEELKELEESLRSNGCEMPLVVWRGMIIDGHNRYDICRKYGIPFAVEKKDFVTRDEAILWMIKNQLGRRNLNAYQRAELVMRFEPLIRQEAEERMKRGRQIYEHGDKRQGDTREILGKMAGVSSNTMDKVMALHAHADEATKKKLREGTLSIHKAHTVLKEKEQLASGVDKPVKARLPQQDARRPRIPLVYICSPYRGIVNSSVENGVDNHVENCVDNNINNARAYCSLAASRGCIPFAPHLLFTQFLDDSLTDERLMGMYMGAEMLRLCDELWAFGEPSEGMTAEIELAQRIGIPVRRHDQKGRVMKNE